ncbi:MAG: hypothetical protein FWG31_00715 [Oscillospiraceae bacterium]|nr:hypothetical protein [Oscillospiraceae bacterium]
MKRLSAALLAIILLLTACSSPAETEDPGNPEGSPSSEAEPSSPGKGNPFNPNDLLKPSGQSPEEPENPPPPEEPFPSPSTELPLSQSTELSIKNEPFAWLGKTPRELEELVGAYEGTEWWAGEWYIFNGLWFGFDDYTSEIQPAGKSVRLWCNLYVLIDGQTETVPATELDALFGVVGDVYNLENNEFFGGWALEYEAVINGQGFTITIGCSPDLQVTREATVMIHPAS